MFKACPLQYQWTPLSCKFMLKKYLPWIFFIHTEITLGRNLSDCSVLIARHLSGLWPWFTLYLRKGNQLPNLAHWNYGLFPTAWKLWLVFGLLVSSPEELCERWGNTQHPAYVGWFLPRSGAWWEKQGVGTYDGLLSAQPWAVWVPNPGQDRDTLMSHLLLALTLWEWLALLPSYK